MFSKPTLAQLLSKTLMKQWNDFGRVQYSFTAIWKKKHFHQIQFLSSYVFFISETFSYEGNFVTLFKANEI